MSAVLEYRVMPSILDLPDGLHEDVPEAIYHERHLGLASKSALDLIDVAPAKYLDWVRGRERIETLALHLGKAIHAAILEPERFRRDYVIAPDFGPTRKTDDCTKEQAKENKTRKEAWHEEHAGATILDSESGKNTLGMVDAVVADPDARALLEDGMSELTAVWDDPATGLRCKARLDHYRPSLETIVDVKSTTDAREWAWSESARKLKYYRQDPFYRDGLLALGRPVRKFAFVVVEKPPPHLVNVVELDADDVRIGREENVRSMQTLAECLVTNTWPGYPRPNGIKTIKLRHWNR